MMRSLGSPEAKKTILFSVFNFFLGLGFTCGFFSANALLVSRVGTESLFYVYSIGSLLSLGLVGVFYFLVDRFSHLKTFHFSFIFLGLLVVGSWAVLAREPKQAVFYIAVRALFYAVFIFMQLQYWLVASDYFNNFEAKRRFPALVASGLIGEMAGGALISMIAAVVGSANLILIWGVILLMTPLFVIRLGLRSVRLSGSETVQTDQAKSSSHKVHYRYRDYQISSGLTSLLFLFWLLYSFFSYGTDYIFNSIALETIRNEDQLTAFFGQVAIWASCSVLIYELFLAAPLTLRFGVDRTIFAIPLLIVAGLGGIYFYPSLISVAIAEALIFYFADFAAVALLQPAWNIFPEQIRGRAKIVAEGIGRPMGILLLFGLVTLTGLHRDINRMGLALMAVGILFLFFPLWFHRTYLRHLMICLTSKDINLVVNAIQALGEKNKKPAVSLLMSLMDRVTEIGMRRTIVLTLGQIQSRKAFRDVVELFNVRDEGLQMAVIEALGSYQNYQSFFELFRLLKSKQNVSFQVRSNAIMLLTRLMGKKMIVFLLDALEDSDSRVVANAIEAIGVLKDRGAINILLPFLQHPNHRIQANTIVALYPFRKVRKIILKSLEDMYRSEALVVYHAALYAIGMLQLKKYRKDLLACLTSLDKRTLQHVTVALAQMKKKQFVEQYINLLLDENEGDAVHTAHRMARFPRSSRFLVFEWIAQLSPEKRTLIYSRLEKTNLDFSLEKSMIETPVVATPPILA